VETQQRTVEGREWEGEVAVRLRLAVPPERV
jgi:hypothetical protein